jgi:uncharacterized protein (AIM24 family)
MTASAPASSYVCRYCRQPSDAGAPSCPCCGAPIDIRAAVSTSGWQRQPAIKDMARIQFGQSHVQVIGTLAPIADFALAQGESIYFGHHRLVWSDPSATLATLPMGNSWKRALAGMPIVMMSGTGPGHVALSDNAAGEVIALPLQHGQGIWVREHRFLTAGSAVDYTFRPTNIWFVTGSGDDRETHYPLGQFGDVFTATSGPGLLLIHAPGNTFVRDLAPGETLLVQPTSVIYCDLTVSMHLHMEYPSSSGGIWGFWRRFSYRTLWLRLVGPGRVAVQSVFEREESSESINSSSFATTRSW